MPGILVAGGAGCIGSHVVDLLPDKGCEVVIPDDLSTGCASSLNPGARFKIYATERDEGLELTVAYFREKEQAV